MPYSNTSELPESVKGLPQHAKTVFMKAFNSAHADGKDEETAFKIGWAAVKNAGYHKNENGEWSKKSEALIETDFIITKASLDEDGRMLWAAVASDTEPDAYREKMSLELYESFIQNLDPNNPPYVSLSHYDSDSGGAAGQATEVYIQGKQLKAKGFFNDTPLGVRIFNAIREDRRSNRSQNERVRISIGFYDRQHSHSNGVVWNFESGEPCTQCALGIGGKVYQNGVLEHLAVTRVPVNKRTEIIAKSEGEDVTTRYEDALSIVGEKDIVDEIEKAHQEKKKTKSQTSELIERGKNEEHGLIQVITQLDDKRILKLFQKMNPDGEITEDRISELVNDVLNEEVSRSAAEPEVEKHMEGMYLPFGGATSMGDAREYMQAAKLESNAYYAYSMFGAVANNILAAEDTKIEDKLSAVQNLLSEFKGYLDPKKLMELSEAEDKPVENITSTSAPEIEIKATTGEFSVGVASIADIKPLEDRITVLEEKLKSQTEQRPASTEQEQPKTDSSNPVVQSVVDEFSIKLSAALTKSGDERGAALQEIINQAGAKLLDIHRSLAETETTPAIPVAPVSDDLDVKISRAIDMKLAPTNQMLQQLGTQLNDITRAIQGVQVAKSNETKQPIEVPQMKSIVIPNGMLPRKTEGLSIRDIATRTTFGG